MNANRIGGALRFGKEMARSSKTFVGDTGHQDSITTSADRLTTQAVIDEVKQAIDAGGMI